MSDLQTGLIILGLALILAVVLFNWWQDWRARVRMRQQFPDPQMQDDALFAGSPATERREPVLGGVTETLEEHDEVDARCEAVIDIAFPHPVDTGSLAQALQALLRAAPKPIRVFAQRDEDGQRARLDLGEPCVSLQLAVLLANRAGPLTAIQWSAIWTQAQALATLFDGVIEGPEQDQVVHQAAALDTLCAGLDATVNLCVKLVDETPLAQVQRVAHEIGFVVQGANLVWMDDKEQPRFTLLFNGLPMQNMADRHRIERLDLTLDVPNSPADTHSFSRMADVGRELARRIPAVLLDDQGRPLAPDADAVIDQQLADITQRLIEAGFTPGDARCARVFA